MEDIILLFLLLFSWFGFGNPIYHFPLFALFLPFVFVWIALKNDSPSYIFRRSWLFGIFCYTIYFYWVFIPVNYYGSLSWFLAIWCPVLLGVYFGLYTAFFSLFLNFFKKDFSWFLLGIFSGSFWALLEFLRSKLLTGFPWLTLAEGFAKWPCFIQFSSFTGSFILGGLFVTSVTWIIFYKESFRAPLLGFFLVFFIICGGKWLFNIKKDKSPLKYKITIVQGNIPQNLKWDVKFVNFTIDIYEKLTEKAIKSFHPDIVVWPETALPFYLQENSKFSKRIKNFVEKYKFYLITGAPAYKREREKFLLYNRVYLIGPDGKILDYYDKEHLVPFGEYVPLKKILFFLDKLVAGVGDFVPGKNNHPFKIKKLRIGLLICYEVIFPGMVQNRIENGSNLLINVSNDAWFGNSSGPYQHLNQVILRAVEQGRYIVRATNTGISAFISPKGVLIKKLSLFKRGVINLEVYPIEGRTFFSRHYKLIYSFLFLINVLFFLFKLKKIIFIK